MTLAGLEAVFLANHDVLLRFLRARGCGGWGRLCAGALVPDCRRAPDTDGGARWLLDVGGKQPDGRPSPKESAGDAP
jgi:hypothetical protein